MENILAVVGEHIKDFRILKRLSRRALGELIGISGQAIWKIETGRSDPRLTNLNKIAEALDVKTATLITGQTIVFTSSSPESLMNLVTMVHALLEKGAKLNVTYDDTE